MRYSQRRYSQLHMVGSFVRLICLDDMLCYAALCCAMLCHAMICYAMLCYAGARGEMATDSLGNEATLTLTLRTLVCQRLMAYCQRPVVYVLLWCVM